MDICVTGHYHYETHSTGLLSCQLYQKCTALTVLYPGCFSEFYWQRTTLADGAMSLPWTKSSSFTACYKNSGFPKCSGPRQEHKSTVSAARSDSPHHPCGTWGQGNTNASTLMLMLFGMSLYCRRPRSSAGMKDTIAGNY